MNCPNCGKEVDDESVFCKFCGSSLNESDGAKEADQVNKNDEQEEKNSVEDTTKEKKENSNHEKDDKKIVINGKEQIIKKRKRHSIITFGIIIAIVIVIIIVTLIVVTSMTTSEKLYKKIISSISNTFDVGTEYNSANVNANLSASTDVDSLKDSLNGLNLGLNVQYDNSIEEYIGKVNIEKGKDSYLNLTAMINLLDKKLYIGEENLYDKFICIDVPEENINELKIALSDSDNGLSDTYDIKKVSKIVTDTINDNLDKEMFTSKKINVNIDGKDKKVKDNVLSFTYDELLNISKNVTESLKNNTEFMSYFENQNDIKQYLDDFVDEVDNMKEYNYEIHIYTSGLFNTIVGGSLVQIDDILDKSYVIELLKQDNTEYSITLDNVSDDDKSRVLNATMILKEFTKDKVNLELNINFPEEGKFVLILEGLANYNNGIESIDVSNSVNINEMTQQDMQQIFSGLMKTPFFQSQVEESDLLDSTENSILSNGEIYLLTYDDDMIKFSIPSTFEVVYNGNYIKSYTKKTDLGYCDIELETKSYTREEYLQYLESTLDYYKKSGDYIDISISEPKQNNVNGREYEKVTTKYTYSTDSFSVPYQIDYYYTKINDNCLYSVEVSDSDGIMTQEELNKFLTIQVQ